MTPKYQQQGDENRMMKPIHFFKIILTHTLREGKLRIPSKFLREYGEGLPNTVLLKLPSGAEWKINVAKRGDEVWLEKGWKEFAKYHSLVHGHFLVFGYGGTSCFEVLIFDMSGLEIDYPLNRKQGKEVAKAQGFQAAEIEILKEYPACRKRRGNSSPAFLQPCKKTRANEDDKVESTSNLHKEALHHTSREWKEHSRSMSTSKFRKQKVVRSLQQPMITIGKRSRALDKASAFRPQNPSFHVVMQPSYIHSKGSLNIPAKFSRRYLDLEKKRGIVTLQVLDGRVWPVSFLIRNISTRTKSELSTGWKAFAKANNLNLGDVCVFELIHSTEIAFRVSIFQDSDSPNCRLSQESAKRGAASQGKIKKMETKTITICTVYMESETSQQHDQFMTEEFHCSSEKLKFEPSNLKQLNKGKNTIGLKTQRPSSVGDSGVYEASGKSNPNYPFFRVIIKSTHLERWSMNLPRDFVKGFVKPGGQIVTMQVGEKSWRIKLIHYPKGPTSCFSAGWPIFVRENALEVGDVCLFDLLNTDDIVMKVSIFKHF